MAGNSFGNIFKLTTFGESHGVAIGGVIDGCPSGISLDLEQVQYELDRRKPGQSKIVTQRKEGDVVKFLSGIFEGKTTGTPIGFVIENTNAKSKDYSHIKDAYRPSHADYTFDAKYGLRDYRGGGRSSARETASRVVAGAIAKQILAIKGITIRSYVNQIGRISIGNDYKSLDLSTIDDNEVRCPDQSTAIEMRNHILDVKKKGDTVGGIIQCVVEGTPVGLGEPVFDKLHADLAKAMVSINAVKGFELGAGFDAVKSFGSEQNDEFYLDENQVVKTKTNNSGGIQGGISNGMDIVFRAAFKPVATIIQNQKSIDAYGNEIDVMGKGRHDACVLPRAVPIVDAMSAITILDHLLRQQTTRLA